MFIIIITLRFASGSTEKQLLSWMPFGAGPRQCIGMRFALLEIKTLVCRLLKEFSILPAESNVEVR